MIRYIISWNMKSMTNEPGTEVIKLFSCSTLVTKHETSIAHKNLNTKNNDISCFKTLVFILLMNVKMRCHSNIYEQDQFHAQHS